MSNHHSLPIDVVLDAKHGPIHNEISMKELVENLRRQRDELVDVLKPFADIKADDGDDFSSWYDNVIIRCEVTAGEIKAARAALSRIGKEEV